MRYTVKPSRKAEKELNHLDREILRRIQTRIDELAQDPFDPRLSHQLELSAVGGDRMAAKLTFKYDREADILYIDTCPPYSEQDSEELGDDVIARLIPSRSQNAHLVLTGLPLGLHRLESLCHHLIAHWYYRPLPI